jgi:gliding motility-associated-like protein
VELVLPGNVVPFFFTLLKNLYLMKYFLLSVLLWPALLWAQPSAHNNIWYFGCGHTVQFTPAGPVAGAGIPAVPPHNLYSLHSGTPMSSGAVCDANGSLQFFIQIRPVVQPSVVIPYVANHPKIFDRYGQPLMSGNIEANLGDGSSGNPIIVPHPSNNMKYYVFYVNNNALLYSLVDMNLNFGLGGIEGSEKDVKITGYGTVVGRKIALIQGCNQKVWIVVRSRFENAYYSFAIGLQGLDTTPVISTVGTLPVTSYRAVGNYHGGVLAASNNGRILAAGTPLGIELYDFEGCSGKVKNARMLDSIGVMGLCFSPDDSKLYSTQLDKEFGYVERGKVYQYELDAQDVSATLTSKTMVLANTIINWGITYTSGYMGDLKLGPDNKLYVSGNIRYAIAAPPPQPVPPATSLSMRQEMHVIHQPNQSGLACQPEVSAILLEGSEYLRTGFMLPQTILTADSSTGGTTVFSTYNVDVCFADTGTLLANSSGSCYLWDDGSTGRARSVNKEGQYWLQYFEGCGSKTDTFNVRFIALPKVPQLVHACPGEAELEVSAPDSHSVYHYTLRGESNDVFTWSGAGSHKFTGLSAGQYIIQIAAESCDTVLHIEVVDYPKPQLIVQPTDTSIYYGAALQLQVSGAQWYVWSPTAHLDTATIANPLAQPLKPTLYEVIGINEYGCRDTAYSRVHINYDMPDYIPNAFSPNGDGLNDVFRPVGITYQKLSVFKVFNRYGNEVYSGTDPAQGWDGTYKGKPCEAGTYYYLIALVYPDGRTQSYKGDLTLIR